MKHAWFTSFLLVFAAAMGMAQASPVPLVYQPLSPVSITPGHGSFLVSVHGTGFVSGAAVRWNGKNLPTKFLSSRSLRAKVPAAAVTKPRTGLVTVQNPGGIGSNVVYLPVRNSLASVTVTTDTASIEGGELVVADFNNDNRPDLSLFGTDDSTGNAYLDTYFSKGNETFTKTLGVQLQLFQTALCGPSVAGDFNHDGNLDVAVCTLNGGGPPAGYQVYLGDGHGGFTAAGLPLGSGTVADVNGDGILDLVTTANFGGPQTLIIYLGKGDGTFTDMQEVGLNAGISGVPVVGDFNGDGKLDVAVPGLAAVAVLLGNGDGTVQAEQDYAVSTTGYRAVVADVNGDGKLDIITSGVTVLLGKGDGTFTAGVSIPLLGASLEIADFNGDGKLDLASVASGGGGQTLSVMLGNGDGTFQTPLMFGTPGGSNSLGIADFNNDGLIDFAVGGMDNNSEPTTVLLQTGK